MDEVGLILTAIAVTSVVMIAWSECGRAVYRRYGGKIHWATTAAVALVLAGPLLMAGGLPGASLGLMVVATPVLVMATSRWSARSKWYVRWLVAVVSGLVPFLTGLFA